MKNEIALSEADTNFTMYQAWVKRATEAEAAYTQLKADLATAKQGFERIELYTNGHGCDPSKDLCAACTANTVAQQTLAAIGKE